MPIVNITLLLGEFDGSKVTPTLVPSLVNLWGGGGRFWKIQEFKVCLSNQTHDPPCDLCGQVGHPSSGCHYYPLELDDKGYQSPNWKQTT